MKPPPGVKTRKKIKGANNKAGLLARSRKAAEIRTGGREAGAVTRNDSLRAKQGKGDSTLIDTWPQGASPR